MSKAITKADTSAPKTVKATTIGWVITVIVALGLGFYLGVTSSNAYASNVKSEAKSLVSELKDQKQQ